jgi:hypothetical protein
LNSTKPAVDDQFWFYQSKKFIEGAPKARLEAATSLQKMMGWLWSAYTAGAFLAIGMTNTPYSWPALTMIIIPCPALIIGYWSAVWARIPTSVSFDPRSPEDIEHAYSSSSKIMRHRLRIALVTSLFAAILVSIALLVAANKASESVSGDSLNKKNQKSTELNKIKQENIEWPVANLEGGLQIKSIGFYFQPYARQIQGDAFQINTHVDERIDLLEERILKVWKCSQNK